MIGRYYFAFRTDFKSILPENKYVYVWICIAGNSNFIFQLNYDGQHTPVDFLRYIYPIQCSINCEYKHNYNIIRGDPHIQSQSYSTQHTPTKRMSTIIRVQPIITPYAHITLFYSVPLGGTCKENLLDRGTILARDVYGFTEEELASYMYTAFIVACKPTKTSEVASRASI